MPAAVVGEFGRDLVQLVLYLLELAALAQPLFGVGEKALGTHVLAKEFHGESAMRVQQPVQLFAIHLSTSGEIALSSQLSAVSFQLSVFG